MVAKYPPVEVGTRGTVGSLLMQEIEYFRQIELNSQDTFGKNKPRIKDMGRSRSTSTTTSNVVSNNNAATAKKKQAKNSKLLPSMCSMVDVSEIGKHNGSVGASAFSYRNLKSDSKSLRV